MNALEVINAAFRALLNKNYSYELNRVEEIDELGSETEAKTWLTEITKGMKLDASFSADGKCVFPCLRE